jgi:hypothetical protein
METNDRTVPPTETSQTPITRRQLLRLFALGATASAGSALLAACGGGTPATPAATSAPAPAATTAPAQGTASRPLTPSFYQWIVDLHPRLTAPSQGSTSRSPRLRASVSSVSLPRVRTKRAPGMSTSA